MEMKEKDLEKENLFKSNLKKFRLFEKYICFGPYLTICGASKKINVLAHAQSERQPNLKRRKEKNKKKRKSIVSVTL